MLMTNLKHVETADEHKKIIEENENVMICCGRMGPMCLAHVIRNAPECAGFMGLPFTMYYKNGKVVKATTSIQDMDQVTEILNKEFGKPE